MDDQQRLVEEWMAAADARTACGANARRGLGELLARARSLVEATGASLSGDPGDAHADLDALERLVGQSLGRGIPRALREPIQAWCLDLAVKRAGGWWAPAPPDDLEQFFAEPFPGLGAMPMLEPLSGIATPWLPRVGLVDERRPRLRDWWAAVSGELTDDEATEAAEWEAAAGRLPFRALFEAGLTRHGTLVRTDAEKDLGPVVGPTGLLEQAGRKWDDPTEALIATGLGDAATGDGWRDLRAEMPNGAWAPLHELRRFAHHKLAGPRPRPAAATRYAAAPRTEVTARDVAGAEGALVLLAMEEGVCVYGPALAQHLEAAGFRVRPAAGEGAIIAGRWTGETPDAVVCCRIVADALGRVRTAERQNGVRRLPAVVSGGKPLSVMRPQAIAAGADAVAVADGRVVEALLRVGWPEAFGRLCVDRGVPEEAGRWPAMAARTRAAGAG